MNKNRVINILSVVLFIVLPHVAMAYVEGELIPQGTLHEYNIKMESFNSGQNYTGARFDKPWAMGGEYYSAIAQCPKGNIPNGPIWYYTSSTMNTSDQNPGAYKINDYFDVIIDVWIDGNVDQYIPTPLTNFSNLDNRFGCHGGRTLFDNITSGSKGKVTFIVTKPLINGVKISSHELFSLYGRVGNGGGRPTTPITRVIIDSAVVTVNDQCVINKGAAITVEFGDIPGTDKQLNGTNYSKQIPIHVECTGGSFTTGSLDIKLSVQPAGAGVASFNSDYLGTTGSVDRSNLGISLKESGSGGNQVIPNQFYTPTNFYDNKGDWNLVAAPIAKSGSTIPEGEFESNATIVAQFQ